MTGIENYRPTDATKPLIRDTLLYRNKGLGSQATAKITRTVSSTVADPEQFLPPLTSPMHVDLLVHGPRGDYREFDVAPGVEKGTWQWSQIPVDLLKPEPKFKVGDYVRVVGYAAERFDSGAAKWEGAEGTVYSARDGGSVCAEFTSKDGKALGEGGFDPEHLRKVARPEPVQTRYKDGFWTTGAGDIVWKIEGNTATCVQNRSRDGYYKVGDTDDVRHFGKHLVPYDPPATVPYHQREVTTPAPFKVGDRVELVKDYGRHLAGAVSTITRIRDYPLDGPARALIYTDTVKGGYPRRFKHAAPAPKPAPFKHGDIIRRIKASDGLRGPVGTLYRIDGKDRVRLHDGWTASVPNVTGSYFELVASDPAS